MVRSQQFHHSSKIGEGLFPPCFISKTLLLNLKEREDRLNQATEELRRVGIKFERFPAIKHKEGWRGFNQSILKLLESTKGWGNILLIEDDCKFKGDLSHIRQAVEELPEDWDALWLGVNLQSTHTKRHSQHLYRLENGWTTHAIILSPKFREWCLEKKNEWENRVFDEFLRQNQPNKNCYVIYPMVAIQRASHSDITNGFANYEERFEQVHKMFL